MILKDQQQDKVYSDGEIEDILIEALKDNKDVFSISYQSGAVFHNFTDARENLINWYPFKEYADVLEIGAGMGALTGILCDRCKHVMAFEQSAKRAEIIKQRYKGKENLTVVCDDIFRYEFSQKFDYILLIGVLEYAGINCMDVDPYGKIMNKVSELLRQDGTLLLAIENQYGLKYWCGAAEDHTGIPFDGIAGYADNRYTTRYNSGGVRTFSHSSLKEIISSSGLVSQRWYYPLPDYKFPMAVFSDEYLPQTKDIEAIKFSFPIESELIADEKKIYKEVIDNAVFPFFANSFLVEAKKNELSDDYIKCVFFKRDYRKDYGIATLINSNQEVIKKSMHEESIQHLKRYACNMAELKAKNIPVISVEERERGEVVQKWQKLPRTDEIFRQYLKNGEWELVVNLIDKLESNIKKSSDIYFANACTLPEIKGLFFDKKQEILSDGYIDMTFANSFYDGKKIFFFDQEWKYQDVPVKYILYRAIKYAYGDDSVFSLEKLYQHIDIDDKMIKQFQTVELKLLEGMMDERKCDMFDPNMYHDGLTLRYQQWQIKREKEELDGRNLDLENKNLDLENKNLDLENKNLDLENKNLDLKNENLDLKNEIAALKQTILNKEGHIEQLLEVERKYEHEKTTHSYKLAKRMQRAGDGLLPPGSRRRFFARVLFNLFRHPRLMLHVINPKRIKHYLKYLKLEGMDGVNKRYEEAVDMERLLINPMSRMELELEQVNSVSSSACKTMADYEEIEFPIHAHPIVSVIIPAFNEFDYTYNCLNSILKNSGDIAYEILIADDCSTDVTKDVEKIAKNVHLVTTSENVRFLLNCNHAAQYAKGKYILFLNNDTQVQKNWLAPLVSLIERDEQIGIVGSKLVYPDGSLQEAGGIVWKDASAWNYGNGKNPEEPEYNYVKEADYISGASIMIRKTLWEEIGGFDERFVPAYYEDSDLAFEIRKRGYKVVYQPLSVVVHYEGVSNGTNLSRGLKSSQVINQQKFREKWRNVLEEHFTNAEHVFVARDRSKEKKVLLMIDHYVPQYDKDAGSRTVFQYLRMFVNRGYHVKFIGDNFYRQEPYTTVLQQMGIEVLYGPYYANHWKEWIRDNSGFIDYVFLNRPHISVKYIDYIRRYTKAKIIYYGHDLHFLREIRRYELTKDCKALEQSEDWKKKELELMKKADVVYYPSYVEVQEIARIAPSIKAKAITAYIFESAESGKYRFDGRRDIMFVGGFTHTPNVDAVLWFTKEVLPDILKELPDLVFYIIGSNAPLEIQNLANENIVVKGFVSDEELAQFYGKCRISVVPLRYGAGIKGKVIEAMRYGMPVVTTSTGAEGIRGAEQILCIEDDVQTMVRRFVQLYDDATELERMSKESVEYICDNFSEESAWRVIERDFS